MCLARGIAFAGIVTLDGVLDVYIVRPALAIILDGLGIALTGIVSLNHVN
jgi:hypothetical protein